MRLHVILGSDEIRLLLDALSGRDTQEVADLIAKLSRVPRKPQVRTTVDERLRTYSRWEGGCLVWIGDSVRRSSPNGLVYGRTSVKGRSVAAHRAAYEEWVGPIPKGLVLDHLCRNTLCINPEHLEPVTNRENILRGTGFSAKYVKQTHCVRGHPFSGDNLVMLDGKSGHQVRMCRDCHRIAQRACFQKKRDRLRALGLTSKGTPPKKPVPMYDSDANGIAGAESERAKFRALVKGRLG